MKQLRIFIKKQLLKSLRATIKNDFRYSNAALIKYAVTTALTHQLPLVFNSELSTDHNSSNNCYIDQLVTLGLRRLYNQPVKYVVAAMLEAATEARKAEQITTLPDLFNSSHSVTLRAFNFLSNKTTRLIHIDKNVLRKRLNCKTLEVGKVIDKNKKDLTNTFSYKAFITNQAAI